MFAYWGRKAEMMGVVDSGHEETGINLKIWKYVCYM